jgi:protein-S-isoprenylcysteine O-methyltransferase Ste14
VTADGVCMEGGGYSRLPEAEIFSVVIRRSGNHESRKVRRHESGGEVTTEARSHGGGCDAIVRNPMYAAWIVLIIPGIVLLTRSWPLLPTPLVACIAFKLLIRRENKYLEERLGDDYRKYRAEVNELFPWPRKWRRSE